MKLINSPENRTRLRCDGYVVIAVFALLLLFVLLGVASFFHLSSESQALRQAVTRCIPGPMEKQIGLNVGSFTLAAVRTGLRFVDMPPEARTAIGTLQGAEVCVYKLPAAHQHVNAAKVFFQADRAMQDRGWSRLVAVAQDAQVVAAYLPKSTRTSSRLKCCVFVLNGEDLVIVSARGNVEALMELAARQIPMDPQGLHLGHIPGLPSL